MSRKLLGITRLCQQWRCVSTSAGSTSCMMAQKKLNRDSCDNLRHSRRRPPDERQLPARRQVYTKRLPRGLAGRARTGQFPRRIEVLEPRPIYPPRQCFSTAIGSHDAAQVAGKDCEPRAIEGVTTDGGITSMIGKNDKPMERKSQTISTDGQAKATAQKIDNDTELKVVKAMGGVATDGISSVAGKSDEAYELRSQDISTGEQPKAISLDADKNTERQMGQAIGVVTADVITSMAGKDKQPTGHPPLKKRTGGKGAKAGGKKKAPGKGKPRVVTLMPGNGIGPEISLSVLEVLKAVGAPLTFEPVDVTPVTDKHGKMSLPREVIESMQRTKLGLKGPLMTPVGKGFRSLNLTLRVLFNLYANVRPCRSLDGVETVYGKVDVITIRENTEGEYSGIEHQLHPGVVQSIKLITRPASIRVAEYCFIHALAMKRKKITTVHKRSSMRLSDGLFIDCVREVHKKYKGKLDKAGITYEEMDIGTVCLKIVEDPTRFDVLVMPNLYGDIMSDTCAGLVGGLGLTPSGNIGINGAIFEAVHGTAPDIAGKDLANPTALLLSAVMMLRYINMPTYADKIEKAVLKTIRDDEIRTGDLGGKAKCSEYTKALIKNLK